MSESLQSIFEALKHRCASITKPGLKTLETQALVAWRDELLMTASNFTDAIELFDSAHEAFLARLRFARLNHEKARGKTELYAEEYACRPQQDPATGDLTGSIELHVQYVLKH